MFSKEDFIAKYRQLDDNALPYQNKENYGKEAHEAIDSVIAEKGGLDAITKRLQAKH